MVKDDQKLKKEEKEIDEEHDKKEVEQLNQKVEELENKYKRALADYQNLQKRVGEEKSDWIKSANKQILLRLLSVLDTLMLASGHSSDASLKVSVQLFLDVLKQEGVVKVETTGEEFDPRTMECVEVKEGEDGKVMQETRAGFLLHDKVLRPALVVVGKKSKEDRANS